MGPWWISECGRKQNLKTLNMEHRAWEISKSTRKSRASGTKIGGGVGLGGKDLNVESNLGFRISFSGNLFSGGDRRLGGGERMGKVGKGLWC